MKRILITSNRKPVSLSLDLLEVITAQKIPDREGSPAFALVMRTVSGTEYITDEFVIGKGSAANAVAAVSSDDGETAKTLKTLLTERCIRHGIDEEGWAGSHARTS